MGQPNIQGDPDRTWYGDIAPANKSSPLATKTGNQAKYFFENVNQAFGKAVSHPIIKPVCGDHLTYDAMVFAAGLIVHLLSPFIQLLGCTKSGRNCPASNEVDVTSCDVYVIFRRYLAAMTSNPSPERA
jgi:hypothetical protein